MSTVSTLKSLPWIEWLTHSNFSFLAGASHPEELVSRAGEMGYRGMALCDFDGVYGIVRAYRARKKILKESPRKAPMPLFYGTELHLLQITISPIVTRQTIVSCNEP